MNAIDGYLAAVSDYEDDLRLRVTAAILAAQGASLRDNSSHDLDAGLLAGVCDASGADCAIAVISREAGDEAVISFGDPEPLTRLRLLVDEAMSDGRRVFDDTRAAVAFALPGGVGAVGLAWAEEVPPAQIAALAPLPQALVSLLMLADERRARARAEGRLRLAMETFGAAYAIFSADDRLVAHNPAYLQSFPFLDELGVLSGRSFTELACFAAGTGHVHADPPAAIEERLRRHRVADGTAFELQAPDGRWLRVKERRDDSGEIMTILSDVSAQKSGERLMLDVLAGIDEGVFMLDAQQRLVLCNRRFRDLNPLSAHLLSPGTAFEAFLRHTASNEWIASPDLSAGEFVAAQMRSLRGQPRQRAEFTLGDGRIVATTHRRMTDGRSIGIWADVTDQRLRERELVAARARLERQSAELARSAHQLAREVRRDQLTSLPNRLCFEEQLANLTARPAGRPRPHYLLWMDLDHFKVVNDRSGHAAGDSLLRRLSALMQAELRPSDVLARLAGDEFAVLLPDTTRATALRIAQALRRVVKAYRFRVESSSFSVDLSIGMARIDPTMDAAAVLAAADKACFAAKGSGRGRVHVYQPDDETIRRAEETASWAPRLRESLEEGRFALFLQRINRADGTTLGFEVLLRLRDEDGKICLPGVFMPPAKRLGLMVQLDQWVCGSALDLLLGASKTGPFISINLGARTISDPAFRPWFLGQLDREGMVCERLRVEVTETDQFDWNGSETTFMAALRARGVKLYVDDFGSGYNSFDLLKRLDVDGIKLDWSVTRDVMEDAVDRALVKAAVSIAESLGLELVAEGVESQAILDMLVSFGITRFQGFYFHRPELAAHALAALATTG